MQKPQKQCGNLWKRQKPPTPRSRPRACEGGVNATNVCGARSFPSHGVRSMRLRNLPVDWIVVSGAMVIQAGFRVRFAGGVPERVRERTSRSGQVAEGVTHRGHSCEL